MASDIVSDAKAWLSGRDNGTLRTHSENCHQWHIECLVHRLVAEVDRHRMTPHTRDAIEKAVAALDGTWMQPVLRDFLDRAAPETTHLPHV